MNAAMSSSEGLGTGIKTYPMDQQVAAGLLQAGRKGHNYPFYSGSYQTVWLFCGFFLFTHNQLVCLLTKNNQNKMQDVGTV